MKSSAPSLERNTLGKPLRQKHRRISPSRQRSSELSPGPRGLWWQGWLPLVLCHYFWESAHPTLLTELPRFQRQALTRAQTRQKQKTPNLFTGNEPLTVTLFQGGSAPKTRHALSSLRRGCLPCFCSTHTVFQLNLRTPLLHKDLSIKRKK